MNPLRFSNILFAFVLASNLQVKAQNFTTQVSDSVEIIIDTWGVPHIYAKSVPDLFFAQGFNAARDRLFQFEIWRRQATGTVSEILGRRELKRDIGTRLFKFRGDMDAEMQHYHPQGKIIIESFVSGVNAYIDWISDHEDKLPLPFKMLNIRPQHWTPEVVISRHQGLLGNIGQELNIGRLVHLLGEDKVREIMWFHPFEPELAIDTSIEAAHLLNDILELYHAYRKPVAFSSDDLGAENIGYEDPFNIGSNNWVMSGEHTQSGYPIMANDPHRTLAIPSLRYLSHLVAPGWNVIGGGEPEIPGISIGHNDYGAWGLTVFRTDAEDLYVYKLNPADPNQYWHEERWHDMEIIEDEIPVKGAAPEKVQLKYSVHGPVVFQDEDNHIGYAVRCGWMEIGGAPYLASLRMNQSIDFESFREACNYSNIPGENMVWADRAGNIGWQAVGIAPIRNGFSGLVPIPGDGSHEWSGYLDIVKKPHEFNPARGYIITANENVTPRSYSYPEAIGYSWSDPVRGDRIAEQLGNGQKASIMDMARLQNDQLSIPARDLVPLLKSLTAKTEQGQQAKVALMAWDYVMEKNSVAAAIYNEWERELKEKFMELEIPIEARTYFRSVQHKILSDWIHFPDDSFGKNPVQGRDACLIEALEQAVQNLSRRLGDDLTEWQYGQEDYKHVQITHALGRLGTLKQNQQLNTSRLPRGGSGTTVGNTGGNLNQSSGATFKIIADTEDWDRTLAINSPGQSGNPDDPHYRDLFELWGADQYFPLFYSQEKIEAVREKTIFLIPE